MRIPPPIQLPLWGELTSDLDWFAPDEDHGYDFPPRLQFLPAEQALVLHQLKARTYERCRQAGFGNATYAALVRAFEEAICGPAQDRLLDECDPQVRKEACRRAVPWLPFRSVRGKPAIKFVSVGDAVELAASAWYKKATHCGALGEWFHRNYWSRGMDPIHANNDLGMAVHGIVEASHWNPLLHDGVAELLFAGLRFFPYKADDWSSIASSKPYLSAAKGWLRAFRLLAEGDLPFAANETTLVIVSPSYVSLGG